MIQFRLSVDVRDALVRHAAECLPNEACGLLAGEGDNATVFYPIRNADSSPVAFTLDPHEHIAAENDADQRSLRVSGVMHSHPQSAAWPSPTDLAAIARFDPFGNYVNLIVSLQGGEPVLRGFRVIDGSIDEVCLDIEPDLGTPATGR